MTTRTENYLALLLSKPGEWVVIKRQKGHILKKSKGIERRQTFNDIITALKVMQIPHQVSDSRGRNCYQIKIEKAPT